LDEGDLKRPEGIKMSLESICLAQRSMLVEEGLIGPLPFFQEPLQLLHFPTFALHCSRILGGPME
jgi:hypothetical protein